MGRSRVELRVEGIRMNEVNRVVDESRLEPLPVVTAPEVVLRAVGLTKTYPAVSGRVGSGDVELFRGLDLAVRAGEMVSIVGESGAGKSSLLHLLAALDRPTAGEVWFGDGAAEWVLGAGRLRSFGTGRLGMCGSFIICCRSLRRWRMWRCRCWLGGWGAGRLWSRRGFGWSGWGWWDGRSTGRGS